MPVRRVGLPTRVAPPTPVGVPIRAEFVILAVQLTRVAPPTPVVQPIPASPVMSVRIEPRTSVTNVRTASTMLATSARSVLTTMKTQCDGIAQADSERAGDGYKSAAADKRSLNEVSDE